MVVIYNPYEIVIKYLSKSAQKNLSKEFVTRLIDCDLDYINNHLDNNCEEILTTELINLLPGTCISYQRRDNSKIITNVFIIKQIFSEKRNENLTLVGYANNGNYLSAKSRTNIINGGQLKLTRYTNRSWCITSYSISRLFKVKQEVDIIIDELKLQIDNLTKKLEKYESFSVNKNEENTNENENEKKIKENENENKIKEQDEKINYLIKIVTHLSNIIKNYSLN